MARRLASLVDVPTQEVTERDRKDYFVVTNPDTVNGRLTAEQRKLAGSEAYEAQLAPSKAKYCLKADLPGQRIKANMARRQ